VLKQAVRELSQMTVPAVEAKPAGISPRQERLEKEKHCRRQDRMERYHKVNALFAKGWTICQIAKTLQLSRPTVRKLVQA
jgi:DNA-binding NarL/FixJ family response regulator